jgi:hypothetical protein
LKEDRTVTKKSLESSFLTFYITSLNLSLYNNQLIKLFCSRLRKEEIKECKK